MIDQLEEIKKRIDIVQFINQYVPLKKAGRNFKALCPFHSEKTPSFIVSPERQIWHCFGACNEGGDIFKFLMRWEGIEFGEALRELAKRAGVKIISYRPSEKETQKDLLYEINHLAAEFYHYLLLNHPAGRKALAYILGRGIKKESLEKFKLGYSPNMWDGLQKFLVGRKKYQIEDLNKAGLVIKSEVGRGFYDRFRHRLMFPLRDHRGNICGFAGRVLEKDVKEAKYINTPETLIYHKSNLLYGLSETKDEIKKADEAVLVEGELDAISSYQVGVKNVVAIKGSALTENQINLLSRFSKNITFALDSDVAGDHAAKRGIEIAESLGMAMKVVEIKGGKDPDEVAQKNPLLWQKLVKGAVPIYDYFINSACAKFDPTSGEGKRKISQEVVPILARINDKILQSHYTKVLAERLGVDEEAVVAQIANFENTQSIIQYKKEEEDKESRREILEKHLLALAFQSGNWRWLRKKNVCRLVKTPRFLRILENLRGYLKKYKKLKSERLAKMLEPELLEAFNQLYLLDLANFLDDEEKLQKEFLETIFQLEKLKIKERLNQITLEIKTLEKNPKISSSDLERIDKLNEEIRDLGAKLAELVKKE